jgi:tRNA-(ms[2]io[6]A)-hydroxylase
MGALIEARSCERSPAAGASLLLAPLGEFYADLERAESRHCTLYLDFAAACCAGNDASLCRRRLAVLAEAEAALISSPDELFRFHSGPPRGNISSA